MEMPIITSRLFFFNVVLLMSLSFEVQAGTLKCQNVNQKISQTSENYSHIENLASIHVYYGSIDGYKTSPILNLYRTQICTDDGVKGEVFRFQTLAKSTARAKEMLFYCYAKVVSPKRDVRLNTGTYCSISENETVATSGFPYNQPSDPYSTNRDHHGSERSPDYDRMESEFTHALNRGIDQGFDPFFNSDHPNSNGPDSISGSPL